MQNFIQDLRYAFRQLRKSPGFTLTVVMTLALSVGVATAVFCVIDAVILRPLPFSHPERIVAVESHSKSGYQQPASWPSFRDERAQSHAFAALAGFSDFFKMTLETPASGSVLVNTVHSTDNFFDVFGVRPLMGRTYFAGEEAEGRNQIVVLGYDTWQTYFGGNEKIVGQQLKLNGRSYNIVGVMPAGFAYPLGTRNQIYTPRLIDQTWMNNRGSHWMRTIGRLRDGVTLEQAQADLSQVFLNLGRTYPNQDEGRTVRLRILSESLTEKSRGPLWTLLGAVLAILAIGCVNIAGLLLARGVQREREMAMRVAIGAGRARLVRQVLTESLLQAAIGAAVGVALATGLLRILRVFLVKALARGAEAHMNWTVLASAIAVAVAVSLAAALYPALRLSGTDPNRALKAGGNAGTSRAQHRLRSSFVVTQVALTLVLLVVSGLLLRTVLRYRHTDLGFDPTRILSTQINLSPTRYVDRDVLADFYHPLEQRVRQIPGVRAVGAINLLPIEAWGNNSELHIAGQPPYPHGQERLAENRYVTAGYFDVFQIPLRRGRWLSASLDGPENKAPTAVVNDAFVRKFIPDGLDPIVQRTDDAAKEESWTRIVGVTGNIRQDIYQEPLAERDFLIDSIPVKERVENLNGMTLVLRFDGDPATIIPALRSTLYDVDPTVPFKTPTTMTTVVSDQLVMERMESWLFGIFAVLALSLALVGIYGLVSNEVDSGTRDIGVRMALGAARTRILAMVMRNVLTLIAAGAVIGLALTFGARKLIGMVIYFEAQKEAASFACIALGLVSTGLLAALLPALRAASIDPVRALRDQ
jgi:predicted permease